MELNEVLTNAGLLLAAILAGLWGYFRSGPKAQEANTGQTLVSTLGHGWLERQQAEQMVVNTERQAKALERIAQAMDMLVNKRQDDMEDHLEAMANKLDQLLGPKRRP